jgi:hypothetical protein
MAMDPVTVSPCVSIVDLLATLSSLNTAHLANAQYVKEARIGLNKVVETISLSPIEENSSAQIALSRLVCEIIYLTSALDDAIVDASLKVSFDLTIPPKLQVRIDGLKQNLIDTYEAYSKCILGSAE